MATNVAFISNDYFKQNNPINYDLDSTIIEPVILKAQDMYCLPVLGTNLYNRLKNDITGNTLSGNYRLLMDTYIQPMIKEYALYESLPFIAFRFTNKNVAKKDSDNSSPADLSELQMISRRIYDAASFYAQRCTRYLQQNHSLFPEYYDTSGGVDTVIPRTSQYFSGIHIGGNAFTDYPPFSLPNNWYTYLNNF